VTFSGLQLATGTTVSQPQLFGESTERKVAAEPLASAALLCAVAGLLASFAGGRASRMAAGVLGGIGALLLLLLKSKVSSHTLQEGGGMLQVSYDPGYWLAFLSFCLASALIVLVLRSSPEEELATGAAPPLENDGLFKEGETPR
jgi:hypothetical protein